MFFPSSLSQGIIAAAFSHPSTAYTLLSYAFIYDLTLCVNNLYNFPNYVNPFCIAQRKRISRRLFPSSLSQVMGVLPRVLRIPPLISPLVPTTCDIAMKCIPKTAAKIYNQSVNRNQTDEALTLLVYRDDSYHGQLQTTARAAYGEMGSDDPGNEGLIRKVYRLSAREMPGSRILVGTRPVEASGAYTFFTPSGSIIGDLEKYLRTGRNY